MSRRSPRRRTLLTPAVLTPLALVLAGCADSSPIAPSPTAMNGRLTAPASAGSYLVGLTDGAALPSGVLAASGGKISNAVPQLGVVLVTNVTNPDALRAAGGVRYVEAEFETTADPLVFADAPEGASAGGGIEAAAGPADAAWYASGVQWDVKAMHADEAWPVTRRGLGATVCVVDTGIDDQHQELNGGKVLNRANFVTAGISSTTPTDILPATVYDPNGHGSHVAGEAAGRGVVTAGIAPEANVIGARVLNTAGSGKETDIVNGMTWCADNGAHVINISIGGIRYRGTSSFVTSPITYGAAVNYARSKGAVVVISAGNSNLQLPNPGGAQITVPAEIPGAVTVGATGPTSKIPQAAVPNWNPFDPSQVWTGPDTKAYYSNWGTGVTIFGPGGRGSVPLSAPYLFVGGSVQGGPYDQIYGVCSGQTRQNGSTNNNGAPSSTANCSGQTNRYIAYAGTSMAAPHVSGAAAVLYAEIGGAPTAANAQRVEACLKSTADNVGPSSVYGGGRVNLKRAVDALKSGGC